MNEMNWICIVIFLRFSIAVQGSTNLKCSPVYPRPNSVVVCTCEHSNGEDIQWLHNNNIISACSATTDFCSPKPSGYIFNNFHTGSVAYYNLTISPYDYTDCGKYTCEDFSTPPEADDDSLSIFDFNSSQATQIKEPLSNHSNGSINITTECIFPKSGVTGNVKWYKVANGNSTQLLEPNQLNIVEDNSSCKTCSGEHASKFIIQYDHKEATGKDVEEVQFRIVLFHNLDEVNPLDRTTRNYYYIKGVSTTSPSSTKNKAYHSISTVKYMRTTDLLQSTVSDGKNATSGCDDCDIKDVAKVVAIAWAGAIVIFVVESCIYIHFYQKLEFYKCAFDLATIPLILTIVISLICKKGEKIAILLLFSTVAEVAFVGTVACICFLTEICEQNILWASLIYVIICALSYLVKCITVGDKSKRDRNISNRRSEVKQTEERKDNVDKPSELSSNDRHGTRKPLPPIPSVISRSGNEKEHEHSLKTLNPSHSSRLPPISTTEKG